MTESSQNPNDHEAQEKVKVKEESMEKPSTEEAITSEEEVEANSSGDGASAGETTTMDQVRQLEAQVLELESEVLRTKGELIRLKAVDEKNREYESKLSDIRDYVRRMEREIELVRERAERDIETNSDKQISGVLSNFLDVADNFERSLASATDAASSFVKGVELIYRQMRDVLERVGVKRIESKGESFDPEIHEAVSVLAVQDESQQEKVVEELQAGYRFKSHILRPAQVIVGKKG